MNKYRFKINGEEIPNNAPLLECVFYATSDDQAKHLANELFLKYDNPQTIGVPCSPTEVEKIG